MLLYWAFPDTFIRLISNQSDLVTQARPYRVYMVLIPLITFAAFIWDGIYIGATASKAIRNTMLLASLLVFFPAWSLLMPIYGNHGLWMAFLLFMLARGVSMSLMARNAIFKPVEIQNLRWFNLNNSYNINPCIFWFAIMVNLAHRKTMNMIDTKTQQLQFPQHIDLKIIIDTAITIDDSKTNITSTLDNWKTEYSRRILNPVNVFPLTVDWLCCAPSQVFQEIVVS